MVKELFRLTKSKVLWCIVALIIIVFFAFAIEYCVNSSTMDNYIYHSISEYKSIDDIPSHIDELEDVKLFLESKDDNYEQNLQDIEQSIAIYKYLYENGISYNEFKSLYSVYMGMYDKSNNRVNYTEYMLNISTALLLVSLIICSTLLTCYDFSSDLYKNIYGTNAKRTKIYNNKLLAYLIFATIVITVLFLLTFITSLQCNIMTRNMLCFWGNKLFVLKSSTYIFLNYLMQIVSVCPFIILIYGFSSAIKNTYLNLFLCPTFCLVPFLMSNLNTLLGKNWYVLRMGLINMFNGFYPFWVFLIVFIIELGLAVLCFILGNRNFIKRDL